MSKRAGWAGTHALPKAPGTQVHCGLVGRETTRLHRTKSKSRDGDGNAFITSYRRRRVCIQEFSCRFSVLSPAVRVPWAAPTFASRCGNHFPRHAVTNHDAPEATMRPTEPFRVLCFVECDFGLDVHRRITRFRARMTSAVWWMREHAGSKAHPSFGRTRE